MDIALLCENEVVGGWLLLVAVEDCYPHVGRCFDVSAYVMWSVFYSEEIMHNGNIVVL
uniref:Uncharacterized protein n=1 Tax=Setaria digitata TaxID=48799 RepID=A0A915Q7E0_9BILA